MFWADDGLDTGPILLQKECDVEPDDTVNTIYKRFLFPEGIKGMVRISVGSYCNHILTIINSIWVDDKMSQYIQYIVLVRFC